MKMIQPGCGTSSIWGCASYNGRNAVTDNFRRRQHIYWVLGSIQWHSLTVKAGRCCQKSRQQNDLERPAAASILACERNLDYHPSSEKHTGAFHLGAWSELKVIRCVSDQGEVCRTKAEAVGEAKLLRPAIEPSQMEMSSTVQGRKRVASGTWYICFFPTTGFYPLFLNEDEIIRENRPSKLH